MTDIVDIHSYDTIIVAFSGGKDSIACLLHLKDLGADMSKVELWHHRVDGQDGQFMDWPVTDDYVKQIARNQNLPVYFSWRAGGFEREMLRDQDATAPVYFETPEGALGSAGGQGKPGTRLKFPQVSANLSVRWCSAYLKIDVAAAALRNQDRFKNSRTLFLTGERAEESAARSKYAELEPHKADARGGKLQRHIDHWRPVLHWPEADVWAIMERHNIPPHPAYKMGFSRVSCMCCIFANADQWATIAEHLPERAERIMSYEERFGVTIHRTKSVRQQVEAGQPLPDTAEAFRGAYNPANFNEPWDMPIGAYAATAGPQ